MVAAEFASGNIFIVALNCTWSSASTSSRSLSPERKRKREIDMDWTVDTLHLPSQNVVPDDLTAFLLGLGSVMKQFTPVRLANVKLELATIVGRADIEHATDGI